MNLYAFELGRKNEICLAELLALFGHQNLVEKSPEIAVFQLDKMENPQQIQDRLGGTIKIIEVFAQSDQFEQAIEEELNKLELSGKIPFALSFYNFTFNERKNINSKKLLNFSKKIIKSMGFNCRFVNFGNQNPKSSTIYKAKVIEKGIDINIIKGSFHYYLGKSVSIQNIDAYSKRDYDKPMRDAKVGMTPPKLAQIMINLAGETQSIYDPFCGTGTYMIEALLMGKSAYGSDIEERMAQYAEKNCQWLEQNFSVSQKWRSFKQDARFLTKSDLPEKIDAVVTESYLGTPVSKLPSPQEREKTFRELENLHLNWLTAVGKLLNPGSKVVMCAAAFRLPQNKIEHMPRFAELVKLAGYKIEGSYIYDRKQQIVAREIFILKKL